VGLVRGPLLFLPATHDPVSPLPVAEELASQLPGSTTRLV
jgi:hypothetical protein